MIDEDESQRREIPSLCVRCEKEVMQGSGELPNSDMYKNSEKMHTSDEHVQTLNITTIV